MSLPWQRTWPESVESVFRVVLRHLRVKQLPVGLQILGKALDEATILRVATPTSKVPSGIE